MRKIISYLLILTLLSSALIFASCEKKNNNDSSSVPGESKGESSEESGESSDTSDTSGVVENPFEYRTLVSAEKPYTVTAPSESSYPDLYNQQLTDGILACDEGITYRDASLVGFTTDVGIVVDLGDEGKELYEFNIRLLAMDIDGVGLPVRAVVYASDDSKEWKQLGKTEIDPYVDRTMCNGVLVLEEPVNARYIRFRVTLSKLFFFTDEVLIYANVPPKTQQVNNTQEKYDSDTNDYTAISNLSTGVAVNKTYSKNVAKGGKYTVTAAGFDERAGENKTILTEGGVVSSRFGHDAWVGISAADNPYIALDLGKVYDNLYSFKLYALGEGINIDYPDYVDFYASENGKDYYIIGRVYAPDPCPNYIYTITLAKFIKARYIKFAFSSGEGYYWVEELKALIGSGKTFENPAYPPLDLPEVKETEYWDESEPDYSTFLNLILGKPQQISASVYFNIGETDDTPASSPLLTDGKYAKSTYCYSGEWFEIATSGGARDIFYDLGKTSTVSQIKIDILVQKSYGIEYPEYIRFYLSENGTDWYMVYGQKHEKQNKEGVPVMLDYTLEKPYAARFVRINIKSRGFAFIDEIEVWGTKAVEETTQNISQSGIKPITFYTRESDRGYANNKNTSVRASDIALVFGDKGNENTLLPYVAYLDKQGNIVDTFMDGFLYTPSGPNLPSGNKATENTKKEDWLYFYDITFNGINGLDRLDEVTGEVKKALNLDEDYKVYVYLAFLNVSEQVTNFGDVDGDNAGENLSTPEGRKKVTMWFMKLCGDTFKERNYKNIALDGFYWLNETVGWEVDYTNVMTEVGDYVHEYGSNYLWIPFYNAEKFFYCREMGFDITSIQPNYAFYLDYTLESIYTCIKNALKYGISVEIEVSFQSYGDIYYVRRYLEYLYYGAVYGYMENATHFYYDDDNFFARMCNSKEFLPRLQYEYTYLFAKHKLKANPDKKSDLSFNASKDTILEGALAEFSQDTRYNIAVSPENGTVTINSDGTFNYYPNKGFTGKDVFYYTYNNYLGDSPECRVVVNVN